MMDAIAAAGLFVMAIITAGILLILTVVLKWVWQDYRKKRKSEAQ